MQLCAEDVGAEFAQLRIALIDAELLIEYLEARHTVEMPQAESVNMECLMLVIALRRSQSTLPGHP